MSEISIQDKLHRIADASRHDDGTDCPLGEQLRAAAAEIDRLTALFEGRFKDIRLARCGPDGTGAFKFELQTGIARLIAEHLLQIMQADGGTNFVQMEVGHPDVGPLTVTIERRWGRAPAVQLAEARADLAKATAALKVAHHALRHIDGPVLDREGVLGVFLESGRHATTFDAEIHVRDALLRLPACYPKAPEGSGGA